MKSPESIISILEEIKTHPFSPDESVNLKHILDKSGYGNINIPNIFCQKERDKFIDMIISIVNNKISNLQLLKSTDELRNKLFESQQSYFDFLLSRENNFGEPKICKLTQLNALPKAKAISENDLIYLLQSVLSQKIFFQENREKGVETQTKNLFHKLDASLANDDFLDAIWIYPENIPKEFLIKFFNISKKDIVGKNELKYYQVRFAKHFRQLFIGAKPLKIDGENGKETYKCTILQHGEHRGKIVDFSTQRFYYKKGEYFPVRFMKPFNDIYEYLEHLSEINNFSSNQILELKNILGELVGIILKVKLLDTEKKEILDTIQELQSNLEKHTNQSLVNGSLVRFSKIWINHKERLKNQFVGSQNDIHKRIGELTRILYYTSLIENTLSGIIRTQERNLLILNKELNSLLSKDEIDREYFLNIVKNYLDNNYFLPIKPFCDYYDNVLFLVGENFSKVPEKISYGFVLSLLNYKKNS